MRQSGVEALVDGFARVLRDSWLQLDEMSAKYQKRLERARESRVYLPKFAEKSAAMEEEFDEINVYYEEFDIDNNEQTKKNVFEYYISEQREQIEQDYPELTLSEIRIKAATNFRNLSPSEKMHYLKQYLKENKYDHLSEEGNNQMNQLPSKQHEPIQRNAPYYPFTSGENPNWFPLLFDKVSPQRKDLQFQNPKDISQREVNFGEIGSVVKDKPFEENGALKKTTQNGLSTENKSKNDTGRSLSTHPSDKGSGKPEGAKDKAEFQTLKSLFKKLQNHN